MNDITLEELLKAGVHFGHQTSRWHPKMKPYIFTARNGVYIIDLEKTVEQLKAAEAFVQEIVAKNGTILFIGTKRQVKDRMKEYAQACGMPFITEGWIGGLFTNFKVVSKQFELLNDLKRKDASGELKKYTKKEQLDFREKIEKLEQTVGGAAMMTRLPDAVFVVGAKSEETAVKEAQRVGIPIIALVDTNVSPEGIHVVIPGNDDAMKSVALIIKLVSEMVQDAKTALPKEPVKAAAVQHPNS